MVRKLIWNAIRLFLFRLDAEKAHRLTVFLIKAGVLAGGLPLRFASGVHAREIAGKGGGPVLLGMEFLSRVGLAAGFDKDAEILAGLPALGFGFAEIGTVTPLPQPGNERPRLFREASEQAVFNRMGFNSRGADEVALRLAAVRPDLPRNFRVGVNVGKNRDTPLEDAGRDYVRATAPFEGLADYMVVNVSSPNTPGLRSLQTVEGLKPIIQGVNELISGWKRRPPLLLKLAPEVSGEELVTLMRAAESWGIDGWVLTNTLGGRRGEQAGGWSGAPLREAAAQTLREARSVTELPVISVGGIMSVSDALDRRAAGADLIQLYSGWVFGGPAFPVEVSRRLSVT